MKNATKKENLEYMLKHVKTELAILVMTENDILLQLKMLDIQKKLEPPKKMSCENCQFNPCNMLQNSHCFLCKGYNNFQLKTDNGEV